MINQEYPVFKKVNLCKVCDHCFEEIPEGEVYSDFYFCKNCKKTYGLDLMPLPNIPNEPNRTDEEKEIVNSIQSRILPSLEFYRYRKDLIVEALQYIIDKFTDGYYM